MPGAAGARFGVAVGPTRVVAVAARRRDARPDAWRRAIEPPGDDGEWPALAEALEALRDAHAIAPSGGELSIALLPPLAQVRPVALPPLPPAELRPLVARNAARYFLGARGAQVVGLAPVPRGAHPAPPAAPAAAPNVSPNAAPNAASDVPADAPPNFVAAAVDARRLEAIEAAARRAGWRVRTVVPAEAAWGAAAVAGWPELAAGTHQVGVVHDARVDVLGLHDGRLAAVRRFQLQPGAVDGGGLLLPNAALPVLGAPPDDALADALRDLLGGADLQPPAASWLRDADAAELAAAFAARGAGLELVPEQARRVRRGRLWGATAAVAGAAVVLVVLAGALQAAALDRQLRAVRAARAALRGRVGDVLATEALAASTGRQLAELAAAPRQSARWSVVLEDLTRALPTSAYLTAVTGHADTLVVEGNADESAAVFDALAHAPMLVDVRTAAPVRHAFHDGEEAAEHFTLTGRVAGVRQTPPASAASPAAAPARGTTGKTP